MIKIDRILVPTDFSESSRPAAQYARELARRFAAQVDLVTVVDPTLLIAASAGSPVPQAILEDREAGAVRDLEKWPDSEFGEELQVHREVLQGIPFVEIVRYARANSIDLIVMGTHGRSGLTHVLIGSVAERVVRKANCPVLVVRPKGHQFVMP
jgi:nucleotide-binding universal stress UspA family protein